MTRENEVKVYQAVTEREVFDHIRYMSGYLAEDMIKYRTLDVFVKSNLREFSDNDLITICSLIVEQATYRTNYYHQFRYLLDDYSLVDYIFESGVSYNTQVLDAELDAMRQIASLIRNYVLEKEVVNGKSI